MTTLALKQLLLDKYFTARPGICHRGIGQLDR